MMREIAAAKKLRAVENAARGWRVGFFFVATLLAMFAVGAFVR